MRRAFHDFFWRHIALLNWIAIACVLCLGLLAGRMQISGRTSFAFLSWNLALALVPLVLSVAALGLSRSGWKHAALLMLIPWLLFFPNAPYILTDLLHFKSRMPVPLWYDLLMLLSFALSGLFFGYLSLVCAEHVLLQFMRRGLVWGVNVVFFLLAGFGIYLGRFLRWNSWEIATRPRAFLQVVGERCLQPDEHPVAWMTTVLIGALLLIGYALARHVGFAVAPGMRRK